MFGLYRTILALMVVLLHIGGIPWLGGYAVFGFYILSGYLMTLIMHSHYAYNMGGMLRYALNRALRIYPMYWMACFMTLALIFWLGESRTAVYHQAMVYPVAATDVFKNLFLLFPTLDTVRLTPPAWALTVELCFYALIGLGLSRYKALSCWWLAISAVYHLIAWIWGMDRYFSVFAASLPFAMGAVLFHYRLCWWQSLQRHMVGQCLSAWIAVVAAVFELVYRLFTHPIHWNFLLYQHDIVHLDGVGVE